MPVKRTVIQIRNLLSKYGKDLRKYMPEMYCELKSRYGNGYNHFPENVKKDLVDLGLTITSIRIAEGKPLE
jgi:hypothetical protein